MLKNFIKVVLVSVAVLSSFSAMSKDYEIYIDRLAENSIIMKGQINDVVFGLKGITDKLDTLIALKQVELSLLQQQRLPQQPKEQL